jgi:hypothetical protein
VRALALILSLALSAPALSTTVLDLTADQLRARADVVVRARVVSEEARWVGPRIVTFHTVEVREVLAGVLSRDERAAKRVVVGVPGGIVGTRGQSVAGAPDLEVGQEWVLYLGRGAGPGGARGIVGIFQGAFRVVADPAGVRLVPGSSHAGVPEIPRALDALRATLGAP